MNSIRARLTFSYAVIVSLVLVALALVASRLLFEVLARESFDALSASDVRARATVAAHPALAAAALVPLVEAAAGGPGIRILGRHGGPGGPGRPGASLGPPPDGGPPDGMRPPDDPGGPPPGPAHRVERDGLLRANGLAWLLGLSPRRIDVHGSVVLIAPDLGLVEPAAVRTLCALAVALVVAVLVGWLCGRWLATQALAPLVSVTEQLERFSGGDFATRTIVTSDTAELGRLTRAYNGAVDQVSIAMTERTAIEQHLRRFLADAGHELRTPITVIGGYVQILRKGGFEDREIREIALDTLESEVVRSRSLVERLLTLARLERPERSDVAAVDLEVLVRESIANVTRARGGDVSLVCETTAVVLADPVELHEAVGNLIDNAVKYGAGTPVRVAISSEPEREIVRVSDGGPGIAHEDRERIFERFFRGAGDRDVAGSGLGLAIGERAAARFGGTIVLEDGSPGRTTFRLTLPSASSARAGRAAIRL